MLSEGHRYSPRIEGRGLKIPRYARRNRHAHNKPDVPLIEKVTLRGMDRFIPEGANTSSNGNGNGEKTTKETKFDNGSARITRGTVYTEKARVPLTQPFKTHFGGGRTGGGGTSEKSLRKAKKKALRDKSNK